MTQGRRRVVWIWVGVALLVLASVAGCGRSAHSPGTTTAAATTAANAITRPDVGFRSARRLDEHFAKHGREFGSVDRDGYLRLAQTLRDAPIGDTVIEVTRPDGTITRFDRSSGAFIAFERDGTIRTFFRPNDGEGYFRRQARR